LAFSATFSTDDKQFPGSRCSKVPTEDNIFGGILARL
jgi:hypothetical protein